MGESSFVVVFTPRSVSFQIFIAQLARSLVVGKHEQGSLASFAEHPSKPRRDSITVSPPRQQRDIHT
jgi:hypothetical protein